MKLVLIDLFEVRTIQQSYAEPLVQEAIIRSVRGCAADLVCVLGDPY